MRNTHIYLWSKKIHRYLVLIMFVLGLLMSSTGYMMHENIYLLPSSQIRLLHDNFSILFVIILFIMTITGIYLFIFPYLTMKQKDPPKPLVN